MIAYTNNECPYCGAVSGEWCYDYVYSDYWKEVDIRPDKIIRAGNTLCHVERTRVSG